MQTQHGNAMFRRPALERRPDAIVVLVGVSRCATRWLDPLKHIDDDKPGIANRPTPLIQGINQSLVERRRFRHPFQPGQIGAIPIIGIERIDTALDATFAVLHIDIKNITLLAVD